MSKRSKSAETGTTDPTENVEKPSATEWSDPTFEEPSTSFQAPQEPQTPASTDVMGQRPTEDELIAAATSGRMVRVTLLPPLQRAKVAGLPLDDKPTEVPASRVLEFGREYIRALAVDERIAVAIL